MENKSEEFLNAVKASYEKFDKEYETLEVQPYNAAFDYYYGGASMMNDKVNEMQAKLDEEHNNYLRMLADADNVRKNFAKKEADLSTYKHEHLFKEMLCVFDDFIKAELSGEMTEGVKMIVTKLNNIISSNGLQCFIPAKGDEFNEETMEAVAIFPAGEEMTHKIIECQLSGYVYNGKIIRYPKVIVGQ